MRTGRAGEAAERVWPLAALALGMLILGAAAASGHLFGDANPDDGSPVPAVSQSFPTDLRTRPPAGPVTDSGGIDWIAILIAIALVGLVALVVAALLQWRVQRRAAASVPLMESQPAPPADDLLTLQEDLLEQARFAQAELRAATDIRDAVIAAYVSFEAAVARGGVARLAHETSGDLLSRVLRSTAVPEQAAADLVALYEKVRFGTVASDESMRAAAQACLTDIEQSLAGVPR